MAQTIHWIFISLAALMALFGIWCAIDNSELENDARVFGVVMALLAIATK